MRFGGSQEEQTDCLLAQPWGGEIRVWGDDLWESGVQGQYHWGPPLPQLSHRSNIYFSLLDYTQAGQKGAKAALVYPHKIRG